MSLINPLSTVSGGMTPATTSLASSSTTNGTAVSGNTGTSALNSSQLGESAFLTLLSAQLKYQNPLQPMNNTQFVAELAQFSQLSAAQSQTSTLQKILQAVSAGSGSSLVQASQLIGKTVTTQSGQSGQVTAVSSTSQGLSFDVSGVGTIQAAQIAKVSAS